MNISSGIARCTCAPLRESTLGCRPLRTLSAAPELLSLGATDFRSRKDMPLWERRDEHFSFVGKRASGLDPDQSGYSLFGTYSGSVRRNV